MADVECANCGEPWDTFHLREDEIFEAVEEGSLTLADVESWDGSLTNPRIAEAFKSLNWEFCGSIFAILKCPCCKDKEPLRDAIDRRNLVAVMADILSGDEDCLITTLQDTL